MMRFRSGDAVVAAALSVIVTMANSALAQAPAESGSGPPAPPSGAGATGGAQSAPSTTYFPGGVAPPAPGQPIGGGSLGETFDLRSGGGGGATLHGDAGGPIFTDRRATATTGTSDVHTVKKGDTLWDICDEQFKNPYQWPRIWSYNPQIQNPHWIYPGERVRLRAGISDDPRTLPNGGGSGLIDPRHQVVADTIFLREQGFVEDEENDVWGDITGSPSEAMFLKDLDEVYLRVSQKHELKLGQELTVFRPTSAQTGGRLVQIQGTVRINSYNASEHVARGVIVETLDVIERGARIGPIPRRFQVVPPSRNEGDVSARVLASINRNNFYGQHQVVFIDKGSEDGLRPGNRLFITRHGDGWHQTMPVGGATARIALESASPAEVEKIPRPKQENAYPEQVVGELRVLRLHKHSAACMVSRSALEIELGDRAVARKGY